MNPNLETFATYLLRVAPGLVLGAIMLFLARREPRLRIVLYLALFVLLRDAMTPLCLWSFGTQGFFWIRLHRDPVFLVAFGFACLGLSLGMYWLDRDNRALIQWIRGHVALGSFLGICGDGNWLSASSIHLVGRHDCRHRRSEMWRDARDPDTRRGNLLAFVGLHLNPRSLNSP
jgi:hypothetical protein